MSDEWNAAYDLTGRILEEALSKGVQGAEIREGDTKGRNGTTYDVKIEDEYRVVGGNVLLDVKVNGLLPYLMGYYEMASSLPRLPPAHYPFPHPDFEMGGFSIRPVIDINLFKQRIILLFRRY